MVREEEREYYLPFIYAYVQRVDKRGGFIEVKCPGGFWDWKLRIDVVTFYFLRL